MNKFHALHANTIKGLMRSGITNTAQAKKYFKKKTEKEAQTELKIGKKGYRDALLLFSLPSPEELISARLLKENIAESIAFLNDNGYCVSKK